LKKTGDGFENCKYDTRAMETSKIGFTLMHDHIMGSAGGIPQVYPELLGKRL